MGNKKKQVVGYGGLNYILFTIISILFTNKTNLEWRSLLTILSLVLIASGLLYFEKIMAVYVMALAMIFILITVLVAGLQLITNQVHISVFLTTISWVLILINLSGLYLWAKAAIKYRKQAGVYFRK